MHKDPDLVKKLDKMTPEQRKEVADGLRAQAVAAEAEGESLGEQIRKAEAAVDDLRAQYKVCSDRAYHLRRLAHAVEMHQPSPDGPPPTA